MFSTAQRPFYPEEEAPAEMDQVEEDALPSESQLVLLCLDHLRDLRRSYNKEDLLVAEGIDADYLSVAIWALSRCFVQPSELTNANGNDAMMDRDKANSLTPGLFPVEDPKSSKNWISVPNLTTINAEILYSKTAENVDYEYMDDHESNAHRFYPLQGLACGPSLKGPLTLGEVTVAGLVGLGARSRVAAEEDMKESPLFQQFVAAVREKGFFRDAELEKPRSDPEEEKERQILAAAAEKERYDKVVGKFRTKLATKAQRDLMEDDEHDDYPLLDNMMVMTAGERLQLRRQARVQAVHVEQNPSKVAEVPSPWNMAEAVSPVASITSSRRAPFSPSAGSLPQENPLDLEEAERLKSVGNGYMQKKEYVKAAEAYTAALTLSPHGPNTHVYFSNRAAALLSMKKLEEAIRDSERSLALKPDYGKAHARLGLAYFLLGNYGQAVEAYTVSLKYEPDNKSTRNYLDKAAKRAAAQEKGETPRGSSFSVVSEWDKSEAAKVAHRTAMTLEETEERRQLIYQKEAEKHKLKGNSKMASRDYNAALEEYSAAIELCPDGPHSHVYYSNRAAALCYLERYEDAEEDSERSLALVPTYGKAHARLGLSRFFMGDYAGAVEAYTAALKYDPDNAASKSYLAKARARLAKQNENHAEKVVQAVDTDATSVEDSLDPAQR